MTDHLILKFKVVVKHEESKMSTTAIESESTFSSTSSILTMVDVATSEEDTEQLPTDTIKKMKCSLSILEECILNKDDSKIDSPQEIGGLKRPPKSALMTALSSALQRRERSLFVFMCSPSLQDLEQTMATLALAQKIEKRGSKF